MFMTDDPLENPGNELTWRRKLNASEEARLRAWLRTYPEAQAQFESETALNEALDSLPNAPVASNFTARVLQAVELEKSRAEQALPANRALLFRLLRWLPRTAVAALTVALALLSYQHFREVHRVQLARDAVVVSEVASVPNATVLEDFEVIRAMSRTPAADEELLKLLQ
jgi:anti-sigma factor RsiW